jgi:hypothetical protein
MRFDLNPDLSRRTTKRAERIMKVNHMTMNDLAGYAIAAIAECHSGSNVRRFIFTNDIVIFCTSAMMGSC